MRIAVTNHAVERYRERVDGAKGFHRESVRSAIRAIVAEGFENGHVRQHPLDPGRRIIPFRSGESILFLSIGPNTTDYEADLAVIGVLYEKEVSAGRVGLGVQLGDLFPDLKDRPAAQDSPKYILFVGRVAETVDRYFAKDVDALRRLLEERKPRPEETTIYARIE